MYPIDKWINCRSFVPEKTLNHIYREFSGFMVDANYVPSYSDICTRHHIDILPEIDIPAEVAQVYQTIGRVTPIHRATKLEKALNTNCRIYLKREDVSPSGSFKLTSQIPQAFFAKKDGRKEILLGTSAGQTGASGALASKIFDMKCKVFVANHSYESRKGRCNLMRMYGAQVVSSPSNETELGRRIKANTNDDFKSTEAIAVAEVMELIVKDGGYVYCPGSFSDFTLTYCTVIGLEAIEQCRKMEIHPDKIIGCVGGGSSFAGLFLPFLREYGNQMEYIGVESENIPKMTQGRYRFDYPTSDNSFPRCKMYTLGYDYTPPGIHATGLRFHGVSPILSYLLSKGVFKAAAIDQNQAVAAARLLAETEGIIAAPESSYSMAYAIQEAKKNQGAVLLTTITGNGFLDLNVYSELWNEIGIRKDDKPHA